MVLEKGLKPEEAGVLSGCSGCGNQGPQVYSGAYSSQAATNANRCSA